MTEEQKRIELQRLEQKLEEATAVLEEPLKKKADLIRNIQANIGYNEAVAEHFENELIEITADTEKLKAKIKMYEAGIRYIQEHSGGTLLRSNLVFAMLPK